MSWCETWRGNSVGKCSAHIWHFPSVLKKKDISFLGVSRCRRPEAKSDWIYAPMSWQNLMQFTTYGTQRRRVLIFTYEYLGHILRGSIHGLKWTYSKRNRPLHLCSPAAYTEAQVQGPNFFDLLTTCCGFVQQGHSIFACLLIEHTGMYGAYPCLCMHVHAERALSESAFGSIMCWTHSLSHWYSDTVDGHWWGPAECLVAYTGMKLGLWTGWLKRLDTGDNNLVLLWSLVFNQLSVTVTVTVTVTPQLSRASPPCPATLWLMRAAYQNSISSAHVHSHGHW